MNLREQLTEIKEANEKAQAAEKIQDEPQGEKLNFFQRKRQEAEETKKYGSVDKHDHLMQVRPRRGYVYHSDYFEVDQGVASIIGLFQDATAESAFGAFWGIYKVPHGLPEGVSVALLEQARVRPQDWIDNKLKTTERLEAYEEADSETESSASKRRGMGKVAADTAVVIEELAQGSAYLNVFYKLMVKAPDLDTLDETITRIKQQYSNNFGVIDLGTYAGEQRYEHSTLFAANEKKRGKGFDFTSAELAGSYSLVTNGINDPTGEFLGRMSNDVNTSGVVFDVNGYKSHIVVADDSYGRGELLHTQQTADMWGSKISQSCLLNNGRVIHIILNDTNLDILGPKFERISTTLNMNSGDINLLEMFGEYDNELAIFSSHIQKVSLMLQLLLKDIAHADIADGYLRKELTRFYIDRGMWVENAKENRDQVRVVGIPHEDVPRLQDLLSYFETGYTAATRSGRDEATTNAYNVLRMKISEMLSVNGSLFNNYTNPRIESASHAKRVVYDFSSLQARGTEIAMAQLVNVLGFAINSLGRGDTVIFHGAEDIDDSVKDYIRSQIRQLRRRRGRVAYIYGDINKMLGDREFNGFDRADYTILGTMSPALAQKYQDELKQNLSPELERAITRTDENRAYIRRGHENVVFTIEMALGLGGSKAHDFIPPKPGEAGYVEPVNSVYEPEESVAAETPMSDTSETSQRRARTEPANQVDSSKVLKKRTLKKNTRSTTAATKRLRKR